MKKALLFIMLAAFSCQFLEAQDANKPFMHCLMLDKTLSMIGQDKDRENIWPEVQDYCYNWVDGIAQSTTLVMFTYDKDLSKPEVFVINTDADRQKAKDYIKSIKIDGKFTYISRNLRQVFEYVQKNYPSYNKRIYLLTDGKEEEQGSNINGVLKLFDGSRSSDYNHLYYVDIKDKASKDLIDAIENNDGVTRVTGLTQVVTLHPSYSTVKYTIGNSSFTQKFDISSSNQDVSGLVFDIMIDSVMNTQGQQDGSINVVISPNKNISFNQITDSSEKYSIDLTVGFDNNSQAECDIYVSLKGHKHEDQTKELTFEPGGFCIQARNQAKPVVRVKAKKGLED